MPKRQLHVSAARGSHHQNVLKRKLKGNVSVCLSVTIFHSHFGLFLSRLSPYLPVYCVFRCYILLLHNSFHFPFPLHFGSYFSFPSTRRPARKVTFTTVVVFVISNIRYIGKAAPFVHCRHWGAVAVGLHSVSISVLDGGERWIASFAQKNPSPYCVYGPVHHESILIAKQRDATVRSQFYFTVRPLYMFRV